MELYIKTQHKDEKPLVLIVDSVSKNFQLLGSILEKEGYDTLIADDVTQALTMMCESIDPDLVLIDVMSGINGFEVCKELKQFADSRDISVIFLTAKADMQGTGEGSEMGGAEYMTKPFMGNELMARIKTNLQLRQYRRELRLSYQKLQQAQMEKIPELLEEIQKLQQAHRESMARNERLLKTQEQLALEARTDPLTGLVNRRGMAERIESERKRFMRNQRVFSLALGDIDNFKNFNDRFGHDCGDLVLVSMAGTMHSLVREQDCVARWGGEEFLLLLPETDLEGGRTVSEKIRLAIAGTGYRYRDAILAATITFGVSVYDNGDMEIDECLKRADNALYRGKAMGKNCVVTCW